MALIDFPAYRGHFTAMVKAEYPRPLAGSVSERVMRSGDVVHIPDASAGHMPGYVSKLVQSYANFSLASAPMLWQGQGIGTIDIARSPPRPFSDKELALLRTFADQAVIAIQNARLFNETNEALERQTATAAILKVISESPTDIQPVFRAIVDAALRLFDVAMAVVMRREGDGYRLMSLAKKGQPAGEPSAAVVPLDAEANFPSRVMLGKSMLHLPDWSAIELPPHEQRIYDEGGYRASLMLPIMRGNECIGTIGVVRETAGAFSDKEIALMQSFVDQAVIAIENVRLFNETKEALEQQTATAEILRVISGSVTDTQPVFDAIVHSCRRLFAGKAVALAMPRGEMIESVAYASDSDDHAGNILKPWPLDRGSGAGTCILESRLIAVADTAEAATQFPRMRQLAIALGYQSGLFVPLLREGRAIGCLTILRAATGTFDGQEVALAQTFADQAVIAIENVRLFQQTQEALARQTATSEVLQVISQSPTDVQPVFDIIAERAASLTAARFCLVTRLVEGGMVQLVSLHGVNEAGAAALREAWPQPLRSSTSIAARAMRNRDVVNVADLLALSDTEYAPAMKRACELAGFRSGLSVPMLRDRQVIGAITVNRAETGLYDGKEIALLQTFARQAVVAIENVRLFNETKESLEQQKASAEILSVISGSVADAQPVFDKILQSCKHLFGGDEMDVLLVDGQGQLQIAAYVGNAHDTVAATFPAPVELTPAGRAIRERRVVHYADTANGADVPDVIRKVSKVAGYQSMAFAPMLWEDRGIGAHRSCARARGALSAKELGCCKPLPTRPS